MAAQMQEIVTYRVLTSAVTVVATLFAALLAGGCAS